MASFTAAALIGLAVGNSSDTVLFRATVIMIVCGLIGRVVGSLAQRSIDEHVERYKQAHPIVSDYPTDPHVDHANVPNDAAAAPSRPSVGRSSPQAAT